MRLALEEWLSASGKIVTHTDIARAVSERLNPKVRDQIQALRNANRFSPQEAILDRSSDGADDPDSWELPTAVSGLIQVPEGLVNELSPMAGGSRPPRPAAGANDTQRSIAPSARPGELTNQEPTRVSGDVAWSSEGMRDRATSPAGPSALSTRAVRIQKAPAPPRDLMPDSDRSVTPSRVSDERKRSLKLAAMVVVLVVLSFFAGRL
jgi:hypothetical protein